MAILGLIRHNFRLSDVFFWVSCSTDVRLHDLKMGPPISATETLQESERISKTERWNHKVFMDFQIPICRAFIETQTETDLSSQASDRYEEMSQPFELRQSHQRILPSRLILWALLVSWSAGSSGVLNEHGWIQFGLAQVREFCSMKDANLSTSFLDLPS